MLLTLCVTSRLAFPQRLAPNLGHSSRARLALCHAGARSEAGKAGKGQALGGPPGSWRSPASNKHQPAAPVSTASRPCLRVTAHHTSWCLLGISTAAATAKCAASSVATPGEPIQCPAALSAPPQLARSFTYPPAAIPASLPGPWSGSCHAVLAAVSLGTSATIVGLAMLGAPPVLQAFYAHTIGKPDCPMGSCPDSCALSATLYWLLGHIHPVRPHLIADASW